MRDYRFRKTEVPAQRTFYYGRSALVGHLVMLSVCMLICGVPSTRAQTGQDARCAAFSGQAHGLCTAAVANGCFDGVQSPTCDDLTANWTERCRLCTGPAPWGCPCDFSAATAHDIGLTTEAAQCESFPDAPEDILVFRIQQEFREGTHILISEFSIDQDIFFTPPLAPTCTIVNRGAVVGGVEGLTASQTAACVAAIQAVAGSLGVGSCPAPPVFRFQ